MAELTDNEILNGFTLLGLESEEKRRRLLRLGSLGADTAVNKYEVATADHTEPPSRMGESDAELEPNPE